jgi:hypothetical protein
LWKDTDAKMEIHSTPYIRGECGSIAGHGQVLWLHESVAHCNNLGEMSPNERVPVFNGSLSRAPLSPVLVGDFPSELLKLATEAHVWLRWLHESVAR